MNQHDSHVIRTLSEAMINLTNLGKHQTADLVEREIQSMLGYTAPPAVAEVAEPVAPAKSLADQVLEIVGEECPHCFIVKHILAGYELPLGTHDFLYGIAVGGGYNVLADIMKDVADTIEEKRAAMSNEEQNQLALNFSAFTKHGIEVRQRLADEELAPPVHPLAALLGPLLQQASNDLKAKLAARQ